MLVLPWFQLPFSPAIIQAEVEQLLGPCHPHILSVTLLRDIMYRGALTTPPPSYLHSQLWTRELRGKAICLSLLIGVAAKPSSTKKSFDSCWILLIIHWWVELPKGDILKVHIQSTWIKYLIICFIFYGEKNEDIGSSQLKYPMLGKHIRIYPSYLSLSQGLNFKVISLKDEMLSRCKMVPSAHRSVVLSWEYSIKWHRILYARPKRGWSLNTLRRYHSHRGSGRKFLNLDTLVLAFGLPSSPVMWTACHSSCSPLQLSSGLKWPTWVSLTDIHREKSSTQSWISRHLVDKIMGWVENRNKSFESLILPLIWFQSC